MEVSSASVGSSPASVAAFIRMEIGFTKGHPLRSGLINNGSGASENFPCKRKTWFLAQHFVHKPDCNEKPPIFHWSLE